MTKPDAPREEPPKEVSTGPLIENLKAPVNVTELSALGCPTDELERDFLWIENVQEFIRVRDYEFIREAFITALQLLRSVGMTEKADSLVSRLAEQDLDLAFPIIGSAEARRQFSAQMLYMLIVCKAMGASDEPPHSVLCRDQLARFHSITIGETDISVSVNEVIPGQVEDKNHPRSNNGKREFRITFSEHSFPAVTTQDIIDAVKVYAGRMLSSDDGGRNQTVLLNLMFWRFSKGRGKMNMAHSLAFMKELEKYSAHRTPYASRVFATLLKDDRTSMPERNWEEGIRRLGSSLQIPISMILSTLR
jgi:hypothetical protein